MFRQLCRATCLSPCVPSQTWRNDAGTGVTGKGRRGCARRQGRGSCRWHGASPPEGAPGRVQGGRGGAPCPAGALAALPTAGGGRKAAAWPAAGRAQVLCSVHCYLRASQAARRCSVTASLRRAWRAGTRFRSGGIRPLLDGASRGGKQGPMNGGPVPSPEPFQVCSDSSVCSDCGRAALERACAASWQGLILRTRCGHQHRGEQTRQCSGASGSTRPSLCGNSAQRKSCWQLGWAGTPRHLAADGTQVPWSTGLVHADQHSSQKL